MRLFKKKLWCREKYIFKNTTMCTYIYVLYIKSPISVTSWSTETYWETIFQPGNHLFKAFPKTLFLKSCIIILKNK